MSAIILGGIALAIAAVAWDWALDRRALGRVLPGRRVLVDSRTGKPVLVVRLPGGCAILSAALISRYTGRRITID